MSDAFGSEFTVGIEDELLLVEPDTHALHHGAEIGRASCRERV